MVKQQISNLRSRVRFSYPAPEFRVLSSVGRAARLHRVGRQFEPVRTHQLSRDGEAASQKSHKLQSLVRFQVPQPVLH